MDDLILAAWIKFDMDKGRSFYITKIVFHLEELFRKNFVEFSTILIRLPNNLMWNIIEFAKVLEDKAQIIPRLARKIIL